MQTLLIVSLILLCALLGGQRNTEVMPNDAEPTWISRLLMGVLMIVFVAPLATIIAVSLVKELGLEPIAAAMMGAFTYGHFHESIRQFTFKKSIPESQTA